MSLSDQEVFMRWVSRRDAEAFSELVRRYAGMVYSTCRRVLRNESGAEEITQDCFAQLVAFPGKSPLHPAAWLHGMATDKSLMRLRAEARRRGREQEHAVQQTPARDVSWKDIYDMVDAAICELPEVVREPAVMHFLCGKSHGEISQELGIPCRTISNRIDRGIDLLGGALRRRGLTLTGTSLGVFLFTHLSEAEPLPETLTATLGKLALAHTAGAPLSAPGVLGGILGAKLLVAVIASVIVAAAAITVGKPLVQQKKPEPVSPQAVSRADTIKAEGEQEGVSGADTLLPSPGVPGQDTASISGRVIDKTISYHPEQLATIQFSSKEEWADNNKVGEAIVKARVFEEANKPLSGVLVTAKREGILRTAVSDEQGVYCIENLKPGFYAVHAERPSGAIVVGDRSVQSRDVSLQAGEKRGKVDFSFRFDALTITGHVRDSAGKPISGAAIEVNRDPEWVGESNTRHIEPMLGTTDSEGFFQFSGLAPMDIRNAGIYLYRGSAESEESEMRYALTVRAKGYGLAKIVVPGLSENLIRQAEIWMTELAKMRERSGAGPLETPMERSPEVFLPPSTGDTITGMDIVLDAGAVVSGQVIDTQGVAVARKYLAMGFEQRVEDIPLGTKCIPVPPKGLTTDTEGRFSFVDVAPQTYVFSMGRENDFQRTRNDPLPVNAGDRIENLQLVVESLAERGQLSGALVDAMTGKPVKNASISVGAIVSPIEKHPVAGAKEIDAERGTFSVKNVTPGATVLKFWAEGYPIVETPMEIAAGVNPSVTIKMPPEGIIEGTLSVNGEPVKGSVSARRVDGLELPTEYEWTQSYMTAQTDPDGNYTIKGLPAAQYHVQMDARPYENPSLHVSSLGHVTVIAGQTARLDLNAAFGAARVYGILQPCDTHKKAYLELLAGEWTGCDWDNPDERMQHWLAARAKYEEIRERMEFEFPQLSPGIYTLHAQCYIRKDGREERITEQPQVWRVVTVQEGGNVEQNLDLPATVE